MHILFIYAKYFSSHSLLIFLSLYYPKGKSSELNLKIVLGTIINKCVKHLKSLFCCTVKKLEIVHKQKIKIQLKPSLSGYTV